MKKEQADTSIWKVKAHLHEAKERATEVTTQSSLISGPTHQPATSRRPYGRDIPQALQDLSQLLLDAPATTDGYQVQDSPASPTEEPSGHVETELQDPAPGQAERHQQDPLGNHPPVIISPMGYTRTSRQVLRQTLSANRHPVRLRLPPVCQPSGFCIDHSPTSWLFRCNAPQRGPATMRP